jgi:ABC-type methionine transport system permease subunit
VTALLAWLVGTKIGRYAAVAGLALALIAVSAWALRKSGADAEKAKAATATAANTIKILMEKVQTDEKLRGMSPAARRQRLRDYANGTAGE